MRDEYYKIYEKLNNDFLETVFTPYGIKSKKTKNKIHALISANNLRPDAIHFLNINFFHMIVMPIILHDSELNYSKKGYTAENLFEDIEKDFKKILEESKRISHQDEISGHSITTAIANQWDELLVNRYKVWS